MSFIICKYKDVKVFAKKKKLLVFSFLIIALLQILQFGAGGDWLIGYYEDQYYFNILDEDTQQSGMTFRTYYAFISIPDPFHDLSYRLSTGKFISWGSNPPKPCLIGYSYFPVKSTSTVRQCIGFSIVKKPGFIIF
ncbi:MAG: hypothetical protein A2126_03530 [Candidatus Woykebacteria bacterium GWB1_45_5]|uniref:Uncharacterized protein n=1 Tax=Candidatus Woykebacteria bacterium GWB1_45_5 TaxID=1802592 RepID=A0A1G1W9X3_9BACT|nr:MAG: hypothetical protein A2126_03530 [Candidatus Woykebacteria bacterium GWB1_45_5]